MKTYFGRLDYLDKSRVFSKLGVFTEINGKKYITLERFSSSDIPIYLKQTPENTILINLEQINHGDIIRIKGEESAQEGQPIILAENIEVVSKGDSADLEELCSIREIVFKKDKLTKTVRDKMSQEGFKEVQVPYLLPTFEGGYADPFTCKDSTGGELYLRQTAELSFRKIISSGVDKVYHIGRSFRNIGTNNNSSNQFSVLEAAVAFTELEEGVGFIKDLFNQIFDEMDYNCDISNAQILNFPDIYKQLKGIAYPGSSNYAKAKEDIRKVLQSKKEGAYFLLGTPELLSPITRSEKGLAREIYFVVGGNIFADIVEFETHPEVLKYKLKQQAKHLGREPNLDFIEFSKKGFVPGAGFAFGIDRLLSLTEEDHIQNIISNRIK